MEKIISFDNPDRMSWLKRICEEQYNIAEGKYRNKNVNVVLCEKITTKELHPVHIVTLACLIWDLKHSGSRGSIKANTDTLSFFVNDLHLDEYFSSEVPHVSSESWNQLNLWRVLPTHALMYSQHVADYLKRKYFIDKDLSGLKVVLDELYANIADHSESNGLAYSFIRYDEESKIINIAFCDFGIGIKTSLNKSGIYTDNGYIYRATTKGVTAKSNSHNKGFGLDTVVTSISDTGCTIKIFSGNELFVSYGDGKNQRTWLTDFDFRGTLIYFDIPISSFEAADYVDDFEL